MSVHCTVLFSWSLLLSSLLELIFHFPSPGSNGLVTENLSQEASLHVPITSQISQMLCLFISPPQKLDFCGSRKSSDFNYSEEPQKDVRKKEGCSVMELDALFLLSAFPASLFLKVSLPLILSVPLY